MGTSWASIGRSMRSARSPGKGSQRSARRSTRGQRRGARAVPRGRPSGRALALRRAVGGVSQPLLDHVRFHMRYGASADPTEARKATVRRFGRSDRRALFGAPTQKGGVTRLHSVGSGRRAPGRTHARSIPGNRAGPCAAAPFDRTIIRSLQGGVLKSGIPTPILKRLGIPRRPPGDNS
jgi:hypothetical protein